MRIRIKGFLSILLSVALVMGMIQDVKLAAGAGIQVHANGKFYAGGLAKVYGNKRKETEELENVYLDSKNINIDTTSPFTDEADISLQQKTVYIIWWWSGKALKNKTKC